MVPILPMQHDTTSADRYHPPALELTFGYDDPDDPTEVTLYPVDAEGDTTTWLTIDVKSAVDLRTAV